MPVTTSANRIHPVYGFSDEHSVSESIINEWKINMQAQRRAICSAYDNSAGVEGCNFFVGKRMDTVEVNYGNGTHKRHFIWDATIVKVKEGYEDVFYVNRETAEADGYKFSPRLKAFAKKDNPEFYGHEGLLGYHSDARANFTKEGDKWKVGIEVEKEDTRYQSQGLAWELFDTTGWARERDGSLGNGGYELVSPILPLDDLDRIKEAMQPVKHLVNAKASGSCGGHMNLSCEGMTSLELLEMFRPFAPILYSIYTNRTGNHYCQRRSFNTYRDHPTKYSALFVKNQNVLEIRLFPAVKNTQNVLWRVRLMQIFLRRVRWDFADYIGAMLDTKSRLHGHLRKIFTYEQVVAKAALAISYFKRDTDLYNEAVYQKAQAHMAAVTVIEDESTNDDTRYSF